jgi:ABC-type transport system substrate-binding protein
MWTSTDSVYNYKNPEVDKLVAAAMRESDFQKRYDIYKKLQQVSYDDVIFLKEFDDNMYQIHSAKLKGYTPWYMMRLWDTWLED